MLTQEWNLEVDLGGNTGTPQFSLRSKDGTVTGDYDGFFGAADVTGIQKGNHVEWSFGGDYNGNEFECVYKGTITDYGTMKGTVSLNDGALEGSWTATKR